MVMRSAGRATQHDLLHINRAALRAFIDACQILVGDADTSSDEAAAVLRDLLLRVLRRSRGAGPEAATNFRVVRVIAYLEESYADSTIDLAAAARTVAVTPPHLDRLLKAHTGLTFLGQLRRIRMRHAARLLQTTNASVKEIAYGCGYASISSFGRDFKRTHACTPREWRELRTLDR